MGIDHYGLGRHEIHSALFLNKLHLVQLLFFVSRSVKVQILCIPTHISVIIFPKASELHGKFLQWILTLIHPHGGSLVVKAFNLREHNHIMFILENNVIHSV